MFKCMERSGSDVAVGRSCFGLGVWVYARALYVHDKKSACVRVCSHSCRHVCLLPLCMGVCIYVTFM